MTTAEAQTWQPTKPPGEYTDDELKGTPFFASIREQSGSLIGSGISLSDAEVLPIARNLLERAWKRRASVRCSGSILKVFTDLDELGEEHEGRVIIMREEQEDGENVGTYKVPSKGRGRRFGHDDYTKLKGYGSNDDEDALQSARKMDVDLQEPPGFVIRVASGKHPHKNGFYELVIEDSPAEGYKLNDREVDFTARLIQHLDNGSAQPVIVFPPVSGNKKDLRVDEEVTEVGSMSAMLKESTLNSAQTPAVKFGLQARLAALGEDDSADDDDNASDDDAPAEPEVPTAANDLLNG